MQYSEDNMPETSIVSPCFEEEEIIDLFLKEINIVLGEINKTFCRLYAWFIYSDYYEWIVIINKILKNK